MKIRNGFVSNSSSSSFVVAFPMKPETFQEIHREMFGDVLYLSHPYEREAVSSFDMAQIVFEDIKRQEPNDVTKIADQLQGIQYSGEHEFVGLLENSADESDKMKKLVEVELKELEALDKSAMREYKTSSEREREERYAKHEGLRIAIGNKLAKIFMEKNQPNNGYVYVFEYSDNDGFLYTMMEHGNIFYRLPHVIISHH